jgi:hypothetical protein
MAVKRNLTDEKGKKVKISQAEIDAVKKMGMKKALAAAGKNPVTGANKSDASKFKQAKMVETVRRLYGETRFQNAVYTPKASPGPASNTLNLYGAPKSNFEYSAPGKQKQAKRPDANRANLREGRIPKKPAKRNTGRGD